MKIEDIFLNYTDKVSQLHLYQRAVKKNTEKELVQLAEYEKALEGKPDLKALSSSYDNMFFRVASDGRKSVFSHKVTTLEDRRNRVFFHKNKQYQWLLSEAYELYADFVEEAYAYAGFIDNDLWPLSDYGSISVSEIGSKDFFWFLSQAKSKRDLPQSALNRLRDRFPQYALMESSNKIETDLKLLIILIEHLRHIIVHNGGVVSDRNLFDENVLKKAGYSKNGKKVEDSIKTIDNFFGTGQYKNTVVLLEMRVNSEIPLDIHVNIFEYLSSAMVSCAHSLCEALHSHAKDRRESVSA